MDVYGRRLLLRGGGLLLRLRVYLSFFFDCRFILVQGGRKRGKGNRLMIREIVTCTGNELRACTIYWGYLLLVNEK